MAAPQASSRLEMLQARFQQRQLQEKEQKLLQLYDQQQQRAYQVVQRGSAGSNGSNHGSMVSQSVVARTSSTSNTTTSQGGKVRQMFDERRQTSVKGIDRSYPLEPLENKPRKQTNVNGAGNQKNGNLTVYRQSVTVKRVARADVNSNLNAGKPVVSYNEEVTRESFGPSMHHHHDDDEDLVDENHVTHYANGNYRHDNDHEVQIEDVLDQDTVQSNRMMAKLHLMEFDETLKHRVRNDLESEEFPEELIVDVPDRRPKRNVTKKLSQAEARLERFKNANAKRTNALKTTASTTKKRSETTLPPKSTSREDEATKRGKFEKRSDAGRKSPRRVETTEAYKTSKSFQETLSPSEPRRDEKRRDENPQFFCRESEKSATTMKIEPKTGRTSSSKSIKLGKIDEDNEFFSRESKKLSTFSAKPNVADAMSSKIFTKTDNYRQSSPETFSRRPDKSAKITKIDSKTVKLSRESDRNPKLRSSSPQFFCRESEKSATTFQIDGETSRKGSLESDQGIKKRSESPDFYVKQGSQSTDLKSKRGTSSSPDLLKSILKDKKGTSSDIKNKWIETESPKAFERMAAGRSPSPSLVFRESERSRTPTIASSMRSRLLLSEYDKLKSSKKRDYSPALQSQKYTAQETPEIKLRTRKTDSPDRVIKDEQKLTPTPQYFCVESEKSATTMLVTPETATKLTPKTVIKTDLRQKRSSNIIKEKEPLRNSETRFPAMKSEKSVKIRDNDAKNRKIESRKTLMKTADMIPSPVSLKSLDSQSARKRSSSPQFYCRESERSATTMGIDKKMTEVPLGRAEKLIDKNRQPGFFCGEPERSATHMNIDVKGSNVRSPKTIREIVTSPEIRPPRSHVRVQSPVSLKDIESFSERSRTSSPRLLSESPNQSGNASLQLLQEYGNRSSRSPSPQLSTDYRSRCSRNASPQLSTDYRSRGSRNASPQLSTDYRSRGSRNASPQLSTDYRSGCSRNASPQLSTDYRSGCSRNARPQLSTDYRSRDNRSASPQLPTDYQDRSNRNASPQLSTDYRSRCSRNASPQLSTDYRSRDNRSASPQLPTGYQDRSNRNASPQLSTDYRSRSSSPQFYCKESEKSATTMIIDRKESPKSPRYEKLMDKRKSPEFVCRESERSAVSINLKSKADKNQSDEGSKSPRSYQRKLTKDPVLTPNEKSLVSISRIRRLSKSPEYLRSTILIRDIIKTSTNDDSGIIKKDHFNKDEEIEVFEVDRETDERPRTPANKHYETRIAECSPKSFTSEVDTEIQEITMSDQYLERSVPKTRKEKATLRTNTGNTYSKSSKERAADSNLSKGRSDSTFAKSSNEKAVDSNLSKGRSDSTFSKSSNEKAVDSNLSKGQSDSTFAKSSREKAVDSNLSKGRSDSTFSKSSNEKAVDSNLSKGRSDSTFSKSSNEKAVDSNLSKGRSDSTFSKSSNEKAVDSNLSKGRSDSTFSKSSNEKAVDSNLSKGRRDSTFSKSSKEKAVDSNLSKGRSDSTFSKSSNEKAVDSNLSKGRSDSAFSKSRTEKAVDSNLSKGRSDSTFSKPSNEKAEDSNLSKGRSDSTFSKSSNEKAVDSNLSKGRSDCTFSKSSREKARDSTDRNVSTYSVQKPSKKRPSLLESAVFVPPYSRKENEPSEVGRSSIEWESSIDEEDAEKRGGKNASLKETIQDKSKSKRCYSRSSSPPNEFESRTSKRRIKENIITQEKPAKAEIVESQEETPNKNPKDKEIPANLKLTISDASERKEDRYKESSWKPITRGSKKVEENHSKIEDKQIPRSMELVQEPIKKETSETWKESRVNKIAKKRNNIVKSGKLGNKSNDAAVKLTKSVKVNKRGFKAVQESISPNKTCSKNHKNAANIVAKKAKYSTSTNASHEIFKNRGKVEAKYQKPAESNVALIKVNTAKKSADKPRVSKTDSLADKSKLVAEKNLNAGNSAKVATSSAINLNTMKISEITASKTQSFDAKNGGTSKKDYERTASVESALKRFDSIGKEYEYQETHSYTWKSSDREISTQLLSDLNKESAENERNQVKSLEQFSSKISRNARILNKGTPKISKPRDFPSKKRSSKNMKSMKIGGIAASKISPSCKRRLFQDSDSGEEKVAFPRQKCSLNMIIKNAESLSSPDLKSAKYVISENFDFSKSISNERIEKTTGKLSDGKSAEISDSDKSLPVKQLRSIEDIRKSLKTDSLEQAQSSGSIVFRVKESESKSAIANERSELSESGKAEKQRGLDVGDSCTKRREMLLANRTILSSKNSGRRGSGKLCSKATMPLSRNVKSPSPDRAVRKTTETGSRARMNVLLSPSKSPDTAGRRSSNLKSQDTKFSRRAATPRNAEPTGSGKTTINTKKSIDVVDWPVHQNGEHLGDRVAEAKYNNDLPITKKSDAFVIEFDEQPSKEKEVALSKKPLLRKPSGERQTHSTQPGRPPSSGSSISSGNSMQGQSKGRMATRAKTPLTNSSPSKFSSSSRSGANLAATDNLVSCKICGRRFAHDRISLHEQICSKSAQKKRKQFDAVMHRLKGTELEPFAKKGVPKKQSEPKSKKPEVKSNWRRKHEEFINAIRSAKQVQAHLAAGGKLSDLPPPPASDTSDYIQCPHCGRKFNQSAAERHIPKCQNMLHNKPSHSRTPKPKR